MTINTLIIPSRLSSLNDMIHAMNHNKYAGGSLKRQNERKIQSILTRTSDTLEKGGYWYFEWHDHIPKNDKTRDPDNVASAHKFILDAFQTMGIIKEDNRHWVTELHDRFFYDVPEDQAYVKIVHCTTRDEFIATIMGLVTES